MSHEQSKTLVEEDTLCIKYITANITLNINENLWRDIEPVKIHLFPQAAKLPYGKEERDIWVRGAYNANEIVFLVEFADKTENRGLPLNSDACAVMFAAKDSPATVQMMGHGGNTNIWHWQAERDAQRYQHQNDSLEAVRELIATGPGTQAVLPGQYVQGKGEYNNGKWTVIFKRSLYSGQEGALEILPESYPKIAFAVWDGAKSESLGIKSISILRTLKLTKN